MGIRFRSLILAVMAVCLIVPGAAWAQWAKTYGGSGEDSGTVWPADDGTYYLNGTTKSFGAGGQDLLAGRIDSAGNLIWAKTVGGPATDYLSIHEMSNGFIVQGTTGSFSPPAGGTNIVWAKYTCTNCASANPTLTPVYQKALGVPGQFAGGAFFESSDGGLIFVGDQHSGTLQNPNYDILVIKTKTDGTVAWKKVFDSGPRDMSGPVIVETADGGYLFSGTANSTSMILVKLNSAGNIVWKKSYTTTAGMPTGGPIIKTAADGGYLLFGNMMTLSGQLFRILVIKVNSAGVVQWAKSYGKSGASGLNVMALHLFEKVDGSILVNGTVMDNNPNAAPVIFDQILVMKLNPSGAILSQKTMGYAAHDVWGVSLFEASEGGYLMDGMIQGASETAKSDVLYGMVDSDFNPLWFKTFGGTLDDLGLFMNDGAGYLLGGSTDSFGMGNSDLFGMTLDSAGEYPGCSYVKPIVLSESNPGLAVSNVTLSTQPLSLTEKSSGTVKNIGLTVLPVSLSVTDLCTAGTPPAPPSGLKATSASTSKVTLTWADKSSDESGFEVWRKAGTGAWRKIKPMAADAKTYADATATGNATTTSYSYYVKSCNMSGCSQTSTAVVPFKPTGLKATAGAAGTLKINLKWTDVSTNESGYEIYSKPNGCSAAGAWTKIGTKPAGSISFSKTGLISGSTYSYKVRAFRKSAAPVATGSSSWSNCSAATAQ